MALGCHTANLGQASMLQVFFFFFPAALPRCFFLPNSLVGCQLQLFPKCLFYSHTRCVDTSSGFRGAASFTADIQSFRNTEPIMQIPPSLSVSDGNEKPMEDAIPSQTPVQRAGFPLLMRPVKVVCVDRKREVLHGALGLRKLEWSSDIQKLTQTVNNFNLISYCCGASRENLGGMFSGLQSSVTVTLQQRDLVAQWLSC